MAQDEIDAIRALLTSKPRPVGWAERRERLDEVGSFWPVASDVKLDPVDLGGNNRVVFHPNKAQSGVPFPTDVTQYQESRSNQQDYLVYIKWDAIRNDTYNFYYSFFFVPNSDGYPLQVGLTILPRGSTILALGTLISAVPVLCVFLVSQRYVVRGLTAGSSTD
jgi:hypothetical protein